MYCWSLSNLLLFTYIHAISTVVDHTIIIYHIVCWPQCQCHVYIATITTLYCNNVHLTMLWTYSSIWNMRMCLWYTETEGTLLSTSRVGLKDELSATSLLNLEHPHVGSQYINKEHLFMSRVSLRSQISGMKFHVLHLAYLVAYNKGKHLINPGLFHCSETNYNCSLSVSCVSHKL